MQIQSKLLLQIFTLTFLLVVPAFASNRNKPPDQGLLRSPHFLSCTDVLGEAPEVTELVAPEEAFRFDTVATFERLYISDVWPEPAFSSDGSFVVAWAARASNTDPNSHEVAVGFVIVDLIELTETFIQLPRNTRVDKIRISPSGRYATLEGQSGVLLLVDIQKKSYKQTVLKSEGQTTGFYPHFYFTNNDIAYWISQTGEVWKLDPHKFMSSETPEDSLELHMREGGAPRTTPYFSGQTRDWLLPLKSGDHAIRGFISIKDTHPRFIANPFANITIINTSPNHNTIIGMRKNPDESVDFVELNIDRALQGESPRVFWSFEKNALSVDYNVAASEDQSHLAVAFHQEHESDALVIDIKTGEVKVRIPEMLKGSGSPNYQNRPIWRFKDGFVFARSNPQKIVRYVFSTNETTELLVSSELGLNVGVGGVVNYAGHVQVLNGDYGLTSVAPFRLGTVAPGIYHGSVRQTGFYVPNTKMGWVHASPDGGSLIFSVLDAESNTFELRVVRVAKSQP